MKMPEINYNRWDKSLRFVYDGFKYTVKGGIVVWEQVTSRRGKSMGKVKCPCCNTYTKMYVRSFHSTGKLCSVCGVTLTPSIAYVTEKSVESDDGLKVFISKLLV